MARSKRTAPNTNWVDRTNPTPINRSENRGSTVKSFDVIQVNGVTLRTRFYEIGIRITPVAGDTKRASRGRI